MQTDFALHSPTNSRIKVNKENVAAQVTDTIKIKEFEGKPMERFRSRKKIFEQCEMKKSTNIILLNSNKNVTKYGLSPFHHAPCFHVLKQMSTPLYHTTPTF